MMVLTHLILNDMVKVKGQLSEMASCIVDEDTRIQGLAKQFFHELAKKVRTAELKVSLWEWGQERSAFGNGVSKGHLMGIGSGKVICWDRGQERSSDGNGVRKGQPLGVRSERSSDGNWVRKGHLNGSGVHEMSFEASSEPALWYSASSPSLYTEFELIKKIN